MNFWFLKPLQLKPLHKYSRWLAILQMLCHHICPLLMSIRSWCGIYFLFKAHQLSQPHVQPVLSLWLSLQLDELCYLKLHGSDLWSFFLFLWMFYVIHSSEKLVMSLQGTSSPLGESRFKMLWHLGRVCLKIVHLFIILPNAPSSPPQSLHHILVMGFWTSRPRASFAYLSTQFVPEILLKHSCVSARKCIAFEWLKRDFKAPCVCECKAYNNLKVIKKHTCYVGMKTPIRHNIMQFNYKYMYFSRNNGQITCLQNSSTVMFETKYCIKLHLWKLDWSSKINLLCFSEQIWKNG